MSFPLKCDGKDFTIQEYKKTAVCRCIIGEFKLLQSDNG